VRPGGRYNGAGEGEAMPELPEVETMVRGLRPALEGRQVTALKVVDASLLVGCTAERLRRQARGATIAKVRRRGKWVLIELDGGRGIIVIQPRMTGGFWLIPPERPEHARLIFQVDGPSPTLWYCDTRRLGKVAWYSGPTEVEAALARS